MVAANGGRSYECLGATKGGEGWPPSCAPAFFDRMSKVAFGGLNRLGEQSFSAIPVSLEALGDRKLERLLAYWQSRRGNTVVPRRRDLLPEEMGEMLGRLALIDVRGDGLSFHFRLIGSALGALFGGVPTGHELTELQPPQYRDLLASLFEAVASRQVPLCQEITIQRGRRSFTYRCLVLPLTVEGRYVDMLLLAANWRGDEVPVSDLLLSLGR